MTQQYYTYIHCKPDGTPFYVGKGRLNRAKYLSHRRNDHHKKIVAKYGKENIGVFIFPCDSEAQALADEMQHIAQLRKEGYELANYTDGGEGHSGLKWSEERRQKALGRPSWNKGLKMPAESRANMSAALVGNKRAVGHTFKDTEETRAKKSAAQKARFSSMSDEDKAKLSRSPSIETRLKLSQSAKSRPAASAEARMRMSESAKKRWAKEREGV